MDNRVDNRRHIHHSTRHFGFSYPTSLSQRLHAAFTPLVVIAIIFVILRVSAIFPFAATAISPSYVVTALLATFLRLLIAYTLALIISIPLALLVVKSATME